MTKNTKISLQLASLAVLGVFGFQNCAPGTLNSTSSASSANSFSECADGLCEVIDQKIVGVSNSQNTLTSMLQQTGVINPSGNTRNAYTNQGTKISETGASNTITAPMWVALTTISSEVCNDLIVQEKALPAADRRFYNSVDFTKGFSVQTAAGKEDVIRRMARSFWARNESGQEKILIRSALDSVFTNDTATNGGTNSSDRAALFLCTTMLSSLKANTY